MKIPRFVLSATIAFLITHIIGTVLSLFYLDKSLSLITLVLNLIIITTPILFLFRFKEAYEGLKIIAIITIVYGGLFLYFSYNIENAVGNLSYLMPFFNAVEILVGALLYYSLFRKETKEFIYSRPDH